VRACTSARSIEKGKSTPGARFSFIVILVLSFFPRALLGKEEEEEEVLKLKARRVWFFEKK